jgi:predicted phage tail component-like protein
MIFTFNSVTSTTMGLVIVDVQKPLMPTQKESLSDIPGRNGMFQMSKKFTTNKINVRCFLEGSSASDLVTKLQALSGYMYSDGDESLIFDDESDRYYNAQHIDTVLVKRTYRYCFIDLVFSCNDPFAYAVTETTDSQTITALATKYNVTNVGQYYTFPTFTITFNAVQTHIYVENTGISDNRFDIAKAFSASDVLVVDCKNGTIKLNGTNSPSGFGDGGSGIADWVMLSTGTNEIQVGSDDATINVTVAMAFNKVYLH